MRGNAKGILTTYLHGWVSLALLNKRANMLGKVFRNANVVVDRRVNRRREVFFSYAFLVRFC